VSLCMCVSACVWVLVLPVGEGGLRECVRE
jgi:hypothetical protein